MKNKFCLIPAGSVTFIFLVALFSLRSSVSAFDLNQAHISPSNIIFPTNEEPLLTPTPFAIPTSIQWYEIEYSTQLTDSQVWMPAPRFWDGNGVREVTIEEISPPFTDLYREKNGTQIIYWENPTKELKTFKVAFSVETSLIKYGIDDTKVWPLYDTNSELFQHNTASTLFVQSDNPEIKNQAELIVGAETNPYKKARLIHQWVAQNISAPKTPRDPDDALSVLRNGYGECGGHANLFVALCRASGIPARNIGGFHNPGKDFLESGSVQEGTLHSHVWAEFYLPDYGWIQVDPTQPSYFARIPETRIVTSKGVDIILGHNAPCEELAWLISPQIPLEQIVCSDAQNVKMDVFRILPNQIYLPIVSNPLNDYGLPIIIDGNSDDWKAYKPVATDASGDSNGGLNTDLKAVYIEKDQNFLYIMVEPYNPPLIKDATIEIRIILVDSQGGKWQLETNVTSDDIFYSWVDENGDGELEDFPISGEKVSRGDVLEIKIPLSELQYPQGVNISLVNLWCEINLKWASADTIEP